MLSLAGQLRHQRGYHEVFHACTLIAGTCHYIGLWIAINP